MLFANLKLSIFYQLPSSDPRGESTRKISFIKSYLYVLIVYKSQKNIFVKINASIA